MKSAEFKDRLKQAMEDRNMTASELSSITRIGKPSISAYLKGDYMPRQDKLDEIAQALGENPVWLMGFDIERNSAIIDYNLIKDDNSAEMPHSESAQEFDEGLITLQRNYNNLGTAERKQLEEFAKFLRKQSEGGKVPKDDDLD